MNCDDIEPPPAKYRNVPLPPYVVRYVSQKELQELSGIRRLEVCGWTDPYQKIVYIHVSQKGNKYLLRHEEAHLKGWLHPPRGLAELLTKF